MTQLTPTQRKELRGLAHHLEPVVLIGKGLLSANVVREIKDALNAHELIKVKFLDGKDEKKILAERMVSATDSCLVGVVGNVAILYRQHNEPRKRKVKVTRAAALGKLR